MTTSRTALAEAVFEHFGASAVSILDAGSEPAVESAPDTQAKFTAARVAGLFPPDTAADAVTGALRKALGADAPVEAAPIPRQDWANTWKAHHPPLQFGRRLWVAPHDVPVDTRRDAAVVRLDPGLAFGTGTHATTALCLDWLAHTNLSGLTVLDYGCGSGILAIAAAALGSARVTAVDVDDRAVDATRDNAAANGVAGAVETPALEALDGRGHDIVLANILARPLIDLAPALTRRTRPGGRLILSGILAGQAESVRGAYDAQFTFAPPARQDDWRRLDGRRSG